MTPAGAVYVKPDIGDSDIFRAGPNGVVQRVDITWDDDYAQDCMTISGCCGRGKGHFVALV